MTTLDLPSGYPDLILSWANSIMSEISPKEFDGDYWQVWTSPYFLHRYDINITTHANPDGDTARVVAYATYLEDLDHDDLPIVELTDHSQFIFIGDVNIPQQTERVIMDKEELILKIIEILQTDGEEMNDGECLDEVAVLLEEQGYTVFNKEEK